MSFLGYIGTLMKGSDPDTLVGSAFGGLTGIMSGKGYIVIIEGIPYMVSAARPENFLQANENNFDDNSWHTLKMRGNTRQEGTGWITWCQRSWLISLFGQRERETGSSNNCALNVWYYTYSVRITSIMLAISPGTCWRWGTFCQGRPHWIFGNGRPNLHMQIKYST